MTMLPRLFHTRSFCRRSVRAFTLVELLVVIGLIVLMLTLLIVALASSSGAAGAARTRTTMHAISQGLAKFKDDFGDYPQVLGNLSPSDQFRDLRDLFATPAFGDFAGVQAWWSMTSPAEFLLGYGPAAHDGADGAGLRNPGVDGYWGGSRDTDGNGTPGEFEDRSPVARGQVYGPYIEFSDNRFIGSVDPNGNVFMPGEAGYNPDHPKVIVDYWGEPIRYYRDHPDPNMNLGDVIVLRPWTIESGSQAQSVYADASGATATTYALKSAAFALLSTGPDRTGNAILRIDDPDDPNNTGPNATSFNNEDNIVEVGQ